MLILDLKGGGSIKRILIIAFIIILDVLTAFQNIVYAEIITENEIFVTLYEAKKVPCLIPQDDVKIIWTVEDTKVASISNKGKVKGLSVGKTKITATAGKISGSCTLYVREPRPSLEISYTNNNVFGFEPFCEYIINDKTYLSSKDGKIPIQNDWLGKTIQISKKNTIKKCCSDSIWLFIEHIHDFLFLSIIKPTCLLGGYTIYKCICGETLKDDFVPNTGHKFSDFYYDSEYHFQKCLNADCDYTETDIHDFDNGCDTTCNTCGFERKTKHRFDSPCDAECNICNYKRKVSHKFENNCDDTCIICGFKRAASHAFDNECDAECNLCGFKKTIEHKFDNDCDKVCNICGYKRTIEHKYENQCDETCDICGYVREVTHKISKTYSIDDTSHFFECKICRKVFEKETHIFDNSCDTKCDVCKFRRAITHEIPDTYYYNMRSHYNICCVCQDVFNKELHIYDDAYDTTCNICDFVRSVKKSNSKNDTKNSSKPTKSNDEKSEKKTETPDSNTNQKEITKDRNNINDRIICKKNKMKYIAAFSGTGIAIVSMVLLIKFKEYKQPRV